MQPQSLRQKAIGCLLGVYVGDALGAPWECRTRREIQLATGGGVDRYYQAPADHKYLPLWPAGKTTDDTQLTDAIVQAFITRGGKFDITAVAEQHVLAYHQSTAGWGNSTKKAVARLARGFSPGESAHTFIKGKQIGTGNGVAMKVAPIGIYCAAKFGAVLPSQWRRANWDTLGNDILAPVTAMTHKTKLAMSSAFAQTIAIAVCMSTTPKDFRWRNFARSVYTAANIGHSLNGFSETDHHLTDRLECLEKGVLSESEICSRFGNGSCYVYDSLPFSYGYFSRSRGIDALYDVVSAGGDTDTNGSIVGALLGALHGPSIFPQHLVEGLVDGAGLMERVNQLCDIWGLS